MAGRLPLLGARGGKAVHQPERRRGVAAIRHEGDPLGIGDEVARQPDRADQRAVDRLFIVEMKAVAGVADAVDAFVEIDPVLARTARGREAPRRVVGRGNRVLGKGVQDVGEHQFLVLLLVVEADFHQRRNRGQPFVTGFAKEFDDRGIDVAAVGGDLIGARPRQIPAPVAGMPRARR